MIIPRQSTQRSAMNTTLISLLCFLLLAAFVLYSSFQEYVADRHFSESQLEIYSPFFFQTGASVQAEAGLPAPSFRPACDFGLYKVNRTCPRFLRIHASTWGGIGDRFFKILVQLSFALDTNAVPFQLEAQIFQDQSPDHGNYPWVLDFLNLNMHLANETEMAQQFQLETIKPPGSVSYQKGVAAVKHKCNVVLEVDMQVCGDVQDCFYLKEPRLERIRHLLGCQFLHTNRSALPELTFDDDELYNVAIHLRVGDIVLHGDSVMYFEKLKQQLDLVLTDFPVHYYFIAERPGLVGQPFPFLNGIFATPEASRVTYLNDLDVKTSLFHMMNADMLITTGSSFPLIASTISAKPVVILGKPKEGDFFPGLLRDDYALLDDDGTIIQPSLSELQALVSIRYVEVHGRHVPFRRNR